MIHSIIDSVIRSIERHERICAELTVLYARKNADYGDSFHETFIEGGLAVSQIRMSDKLNRFKNLIQNRDTELGEVDVLRQVMDESIRDTLLDLANYAIMTIMELDSASAQVRDANSADETVTSVTPTPGEDGVEEPEVSE